MVKPVELQDLMSKTQATERAQQIQQAHPEVAQRQAAQAQTQQAVEDQRRPTPSPTADQVIIRSEQRGRSGEGKGKDRSRKQRKPLEEDRSEEEVSGARDHIDVVA